MSIGYKFLLFVFTFWIFGVVICNITAGADLALSSTQASAEEISNIGDPISWSERAVNSFTWDWDVFKNADGSANSWSFIKWIFLWPITAIVAVTFIWILYQIGASVIGGIFKWF